MSNLSLNDRFEGAKPPHLAGVPAVFPGPGERNFVPALSQERKSRSRGVRLPPSSKHQFVEARALSTLQQIDDYIDLRGAFGATGSRLHSVRLRRSFHTNELSPRGRYDGSARHALLGAPSRRFMSCPTLASQPVLKKRQDTLPDPYRLTTKVLRRQHKHAVRSDGSRVQQRKLKVAWSKHRLSSALLVDVVH
jgi:hypothetical protein